jgi:hypothetical protein
VAATGRTSLGLGTLATQSGTFSGTSSGTNTGDQTTVSGNAGTATALQTPRNINGVAFDGTANITVASVGTKTITVENPTATENIPFCFTTAGGTITKVIAVLVGSSTPSVTYNIGYGTDVTSLTNVTTSPSAVTSTTTGTTATLNNVTVPANGWLVLKTTAQSGTVNSITVTVEF